MRWIVLLSLATFSIAVGSTTITADSVTQGWSKTCVRVSTESSQSREAR